MYKKILVPVDGSELAECALGHVRAIAKGCNVPEVVLLMVVEPLRNTYELGEDWYKSAEEKIRADAKDYLSKEVAALKKDSITASAVVMSDQPAEAILNYAKRNQVDLIIMSTHGRTGVSRWVIGSVADRVVHHSVAPVLSVSPAGCRV